jgi:putative redox protein
MTDKSKEVNASLQLLNNRLHFEGTADENRPISIDYIPPFGDNLGYTSLELLLLSLSSCVGSSVLVFLRRMKKTITGFKINATGIRKEENPTGFKTIQLEIFLTSTDTTTEELEKLLKLAEETYCPVWSMLRGNVEIQIHTNITQCDEC